MIHGHGNEIYQYGRMVRYDFSSNVVPHGFDSRLKTYLLESIDAVQHYPEPDAGRLKQTIAAYHGLESSNVLVTNGSTEAFYLLAQLFSGNRSTVIIPSFAEYEDACCAYGHIVSFQHNRHLSAHTSFAADVVWIGNPNNPDGLVIAPHIIEQWCRRYPHTIFIVDEAYADLCFSFRSVVRLVSSFPNLIVVRSLTKTFAIPGIRLGYIVADEMLLTQVLRIPWQVNSLAAEVGISIMKNYDDHLPDIAHILSNTRKLQNDISSIGGYDVVPSNCNFFAVKMQTGKASELKQYLLETEGILIRDASNFRGLDETWFRVAIQSAEANELLRNALGKYLVLTEKKNSLNCFLQK